MRNFANCDSICLLTFSHSLLIRLKTTWNFRNLVVPEIWWNSHRWSWFSKNVLMGWVGWVKTQEVFRCVINSTCRILYPSHKPNQPGIPENATLQGTVKCSFRIGCAFLVHQCKLSLGCQNSTCQNVRKLPKLAGWLKNWDILYGNGRGQEICSYFSVFFGLVAPFFGDSAGWPNLWLLFPPCGKYVSDLWSWDRLLGSPWCFCESLMHLMLDVKSSCFGKRWRILKNISRTSRNGRFLIFFVCFRFSQKLSSLAIHSISKVLMIFVWIKWSLK